MVMGLPMRRCRVAMAKTGRDSFQPFQHVHCRDSLVGLFEELVVSAGWIAESAQL